MSPTPRKPASKKPAQKKPAQKRWGNVARKGGEVVREDQETASRIWREAVKRAREHGDTSPPPPEGWQPEQVVRERPPAKATTAPAPRRRDTPRTLSPESAAELAQIKGPRGAPRLQQRLADAAGAYERSRYQDARRMLKALADAAPGAASVRELHGLTLYELGKWREAARELEAFRALTGSVEQHPVLADCYRALRRYKVVDELWEELRQASPSAELVAEGRIVAAGARADQGDISGAIVMLEKAKLDVKRPKEHHLRVLYALADLYERAGDIPRARELFQRVVRHDPRFFDAADRLKSL